MQWHISALLAHLAPMRYLICLALSQLVQWIDIFQRLCRAYEVSTQQMIVCQSPY